MEERVMCWYDLWPIAVLLLLMLGTIWLTRKGEQEEDRMRKDGRIPPREEER